ncbi:MAG: hypothetical protein KIT43_11230 [Bauldia sp.]|nr:hypothetical protein [Bauldia sp.]
MKHWLSLSVVAAAALALSAGTALAAGPVCSAEYERVAGGYEWRGTILADDGKLYDFEIASITEAGAIAAIAAGERGARGAYEALLMAAVERATVVTPEAIGELQALIAGAATADMTIVDGTTGGGTWSILCFTAPDAATPHSDPVLIERRGDRTGVNAAADELRTALIAIDPAFALGPAATGSKPGPR